MKIPRTIKRYEVVDLIAEGGMGALYRARDPLIGRQVAIKMLRAAYDTPELHDRFAREARAAGGLTHPNIVTIYDVGEHEGLPFIAMEYVRGDTFAELVCLSPPLSLHRKLQLAEEVCAGLAHAHESGIVHRDIKPANLIVGPEGTVKILDFGIAKLTETGITLPGAVLGTLNYMSPEQFKGTAVDARSDIFSFGAVLYELLSHQQAFPGEASDVVFQRVVNGSPTPITEYCPDLDSRLVRLVERALEKDPARRFQTATAVQKELSSIRQMTRTGSGQGAIEARQRHVRATLERARLALASGDATTALRDVQQALTLDPDNAEGHALSDASRAAISQRQEEERIQAAIDDARRRFFGGDHQTAIQALLDLQSSSPLVETAIQQLRLAWHEIEERERAEHERIELRRRIAGQVAAIETGLRDERLDDAAQALETLRALDPTLSELAPLAGRLAQAQAAARLKADLERALGGFEEAFANGELLQAGNALEAATALSPASPLVRSARQRLEQAVAAVAAREAAEARRREGEARLDAAGARLDEGDLSGAADLLTRAADLMPQHPRLIALSEQLAEANARQAAAEAAERLRQQIEGLIQSASQQLQSAGDAAADLKSALRDVSQALALDPANGGAAALKATIEGAIAERRQAERMRTAIQNARTRFANGKHQAAIRLLEDYQPPSQPEVTAALSELRAALVEIEEQRRAEQERAERQERAAALFAAALSALRDQRFDEALGLVASAEEVDATAPNLRALRERILHEQADAQRQGELERLLADLYERLTNGEFPEASERLNAAMALGPDDGRVIVAGQRLTQAIAARDAAEARKRELEEKVAAAALLLEQGDLQGARRSVTLALNLDPRDPEANRLFGLVADAIDRQETAERLRQDVERLLAAAGRTLRSPERRAADVRLARQQIAQALTLAPEDAAAQALMVSADESLAAFREAARIDAAIRNAHSRFANKKYQSAFQLLAALDGSNPAVAEAVTELRTKLDAIERHQAEAVMADTQILNRESHGPAATEATEEPARARPGAEPAPDPIAPSSRNAPGRTVTAEVTPAETAVNRTGQPPATVIQRTPGNGPAADQEIVTSPRTAEAPVHGSNGETFKDDGARKRTSTRTSAQPVDQPVESAAHGLPVPVMVAAGLLLFTVLLVLLRLALF